MKYMISRVLNKCPIWLIAPLRSDFTKNLLILFGGNAGAQAITLATIPIISRLYRPDDFGVFTILSSIAIILIPISTLRFDLASVMPKDDDSAYNLVALGLISVFLIVGFITGSLLLIEKVIPDYFENQKIGNYRWMVPAGVMIMGGYQLCRFWRVRTKAFKSVAFSRISNVVIARGLTISLAFWFGSNIFGLVSGYLLGALAGLIVVFMHPSMFPVKACIKKLSWVQMKKLVYEYRQFPLFSTFNNLLMSLSQNITVFLLSYLFSPAVVGFYGIALRVIQQPTRILTTSLQDSLFQKMTEKRKSSQQILPLFKKSIYSLSIAAIVPTFVMGIWAPKLFSVIFGDEWSPAGHYARVISPLFFFNFISSPANVVFEIAQKQQHRFLINFSMIVLSTIGILTASAVYHKGPETCLFVYSFLICVLKAVLIMTAYRVVYGIDQKPKI